jgi:hypothetical protein
MGFGEVLAWFAERRGRRVHVVVYLEEVPLASFDGPLGAAVEQDASVLTDRTGRAPVVFAVGEATVGLDEELFVSAELVGSSIAIRLRGSVELVAHAWRD